jgi:hypothetical protein
MGKYCSMQVQVCALILKIILVVIGYTGWAIHIKDDT